MFFFVDCNDTTSTPLIIEDKIMVAIQAHALSSMTISRIRKVHIYIYIYIYIYMFVNTKNKSVSFANYIDIYICIYIYIYIHIICKTRRYILLFFKLNLTL